MSSYINKDNGASKDTHNLILHISFIRILASSIIFAVHCVTHGQTEKTREVAWDDIVEMVSENVDEDMMEESLLEELYELYQHPFDINTASAEQIAQLPFISNEQATDITNYINRNGEMLSLGELMMIPSLNAIQRKLLRHFSAINHRDAFEMPSRREMVKESKQEVAWSTSIPLYTKAGYRHVDQEVLDKSPNKIYRGDRYRHSMRYAMKSTDRLSAGQQMEKDAGETGVDYWAGYVMVNKVGLVKKAIAGCYKISFGKGLAINTSAKLGKMMMTTSLDRMDKGMTPHSSMSESGYFRGAAVTLQSGRWELSAYASYRPVDATIRNDSTGISSLKTDGLHRTTLEKSKRGNIHITDFGTNVHWGIHPLQLSATLATTFLSLPLLPSYNTKSSAYRKYNAQGRRFIVGSIAYSWKRRTITFSGETAMSGTEKQNGTATLNCLRWKANSSNTFSLIGRYYGAQFNSINGKAFGENAAVQNEAGVMAAWSSRSLQDIVLDTHVDLMYFPWMKSGVSASSHAFEVMAQATYTPSAYTTMTLRYKMKSKQKDVKIDSGSKEALLLGWRTSHSIKWQLTHQLSSSLQIRATALGTYIITSFATPHSGFSIGGNLRWSHPSTKRWVNISSTIFLTDSYEARLYGYETNLPYTFASSSYYYKGLRLVFAASLPSFHQRLTLNTKLSSTIYFDRKTIGSALETINSSHREDIQVQVIWRI